MVNVVNVVINIVHWLENLMIEECPGAVIFVCFASFFFVTVAAVAAPVID